MPTPEPVAPDHGIATILRHDAERNTYKIALIRALNDIVTGFPDLAAGGRPLLPQVQPQPDLPNSPARTTPLSRRFKWR